MWFSCCQGGSGESRESAIRADVGPRRGSGGTAGLHVWVPKTLDRLCDLRVFVEQAAAAIASGDRTRRVSSHWWELTQGCRLAQGTVGSVGVEVCLVLRQDGSGVRGVDDQEPVKQFTADTAHDPLTDRVRPRRPDQDPDHLRAGAGDDGVERILSRNTVRRFARAASPEELLVHDGTGRRASILDEHSAHLRERWNSGCTNAAQLWQEIRDRGYTGSCRQVRGYVRRFRGNAAVPAPPPVPPKVRAVTAWIMTRPDRLADADRASLDAILAASTELAAVAASVRGFAAIMNERRGRKQLEPWMAAALATGEPALRSFVTGLRADHDAVTNGLSLPWSSGAVEGHVNRIKMLKRQMYGWASPDLLRRRVILAN